MRKITILNFFFFIELLIIFVINLIMFKSDITILTIVLSAIYFVLLYPLIRKRIFVKNMKCRKFTSEDVYITYERLLLLQEQYENNKKSLEENEIQFELKKQEFEQEKKFTQETVKFIEDELAKISNDMPGESFERFVGFCLMTRGWKIIKYTKRIGDYGADIIALNPNGIKTCIQCKRYSTENVGVDAVQQVYASEKYYNCTCGAVVTNSKFTRSARKLAEKTGVILFENFPKKEKQNF